jgi:predicted secreted protein
VSWPTIAAIYFIMWWTVLFAVLPWGVRSQGESGDVAPGTDPGAPNLPALGRKLIWTTLVSAVLFGVFYYCYVTRVVTLDDLAAWLGIRL